MAHCLQIAPPGHPPGPCQPVLGEPLQTNENGESSPTSLPDKAFEVELKTQSCASEAQESRDKFSWLQFASFAGTGLLASVAYLDPGNLEADIQLGVASSMSLLWWTAICCLVFGFTFQCLAGRLGLVTGRDLPQHLGERYSKPARILLWLLIEVAIIGADIQETIGSAIALTILTSGRLPLAAGCVVVSLSAFGLLLLDRLGFRKVEAVFAMFLAIEAACMAVNFVQAQIPSAEVAKGVFIPRLSRDTVPVAVGALGALVMPYNIFYQSSIINARPRGADNDGKMRVLLHYLRLENFLVLLAAFVINLFVICVFAEGFCGVYTEDEVGLESAGDFLAERYGAVFRTVWAVGLLASGQVSTIGLTHAGQLVMMGLLNMKVRAGPRMIATRLVALVPTVALAVVFEASHTFDRVAQLLNIVQSLMLPFALIPVIHVCADKQLMGKFVSHPALTVFSGMIATAVTAVNGYLLVDFLHTELPQNGGVYTGFAIFIMVYFVVVLYYAVGPEHWSGLLQRAEDAGRKGVSWLRSNVRVRGGNFETMLEVHH